MKVIHFSFVKASTSKIKGTGTTVEVLEKTPKSLQTTAKSDESYACASRV